MTTHSSPNRIVWEYFHSLRRLVETSKTAPSEALCRQSAALAVVMAVTVVEVFLNVWFRVRAAEMNDNTVTTSLLRDISARASLDQKLKKWPNRLLNKNLDLTSGAGKAFIELKECRNRIVHFSSTHETIVLGEATFLGLANTSEYDALDADKACWALSTAERIVEEIFRLAKSPPSQIASQMHAWTGMTSASPRDGDDSKDAGLSSSTL